MTFSKYLHWFPSAHNKIQTAQQKHTGSLSRGSDFLVQTQCPASLPPTPGHSYLPLPLSFTSEPLPSLVPPPFTWLPPSSIRSQPHHRPPPSDPSPAGPSSSVLMQLRAPGTSYCGYARTGSLMRAGTMTGPSLPPQNPTTLGAQALNKFAWNNEKINKRNSSPL